MRIVCLYNPISGAGNGQQIAERLVAEFLKLGIAATAVNSRQFVYESITQSSDEYVVVVGGDGTLRDQIEGLTRSALPVIFYPAGNESLFAKAFPCPRSPESFARAVGRGTARTIFPGRVGNSFFTTMISVGFDAEVVRYASEGRSKPLGNRGYLSPILRALRNYRSPELSIQVDGREVVTRTRGWAIVARSPFYAAGLTPVPEADFTKPELVGRFYPYCSQFFWLRWAFAAIGIKQFVPSTFITFRGSDVAISASGVAPVQMDGDYFGTTPVQIKLSAPPVNAISLSPEQTELKIV